MEEGGGGERGQIALRRSLVCVDNKLKRCFSLGDEKQSIHRLLKTLPPVKTIAGAFSERKLLQNSIFFCLVELLFHRVLATDPQ